MIMTMTVRLHPVPVSDLEELRQQEDVPDDFYDDPGCDLGQAWDVIHAVLNVDEDEWGGKAVLGGEPFGEDQGFGPPRTLAPDEVAQVWAALSVIDEAEFRRRFAVVDLAEVYAGQHYDAGKAYGHLQELRECYSRATTAGHAMALFM